MGAEHDARVGEPWPSVTNVSAAPGIATATKAAAPGKRHRCTGLSISATAAPAAAVEATLALGATIVERIKLPAAAFPPIVVNFDPPYEAADNEKVELVIPSLGGAVISVATIRGRSFGTSSATV